MDAETPDVPATIGQTLTPFLLEHHVQTGVDMEILTDVAATDGELLSLVLVYAELPGVADEAATRATQAEIQAAATTAAEGIGEQIRERIAVLARSNDVAHFRS